MATRARKALDRIQPYVPGKSVSDLMRTLGIADAVKLSSNENPLGPSPAAVQAAAEAVAQSHIYPDGASRDLREAIARHHGVSSDQIIVGCGSDELIRMLGEAYLEPKLSAVFADVTFSQYSFVARIMGAEEVTVPLRDGVHDLREMAYFTRKHQAKLCFVCNPNNPTGTYVKAPDVARFLDAIPKDTLVVFDEAYIEYVDAPDFPDVLTYLKEGRNVITLRTFSKIYGLAGLRVGYGIASPETIQNLDKIRPPFNVNIAAQAAALAALADQDHVKKSFEINRVERERLIREFSDLGLNPLPSQSNFVWVDVGRPSVPVYEALLHHGVIVRDGTPFGVPTALRITVGKPQQNDRLISAMKTVIQSGVMERGMIR